MQLKQARVRGRVADLLAGRGYQNVSFVSRRYTCELLHAIDCAGEDVFIKRSVAGRNVKEQRAILRLQHCQTIVPVLDSWEEVHGEAMFVMPRLAELLPPDRYSLEQIWCFMDDLTQAVEVTHEADMVHADIKVPNTLVDPKTGRLVLIDFGHVLENVGRRFLWPIAYGTPDWMSPDVVNGRGRGVAPDVWALGRWLYHMIECKLPTHLVWSYQAFPIKIAKMDPGLEGLEAQPLLLHAVRLTAKLLSNNYSLSRCRRDVTAALALFGNSDTPVPIALD